MARMGHEVIHIGPPVTPLHGLMNKGDYKQRFRDSFRGPVQLEERLISITPLSLLPWQVARRKLTPWNLFVTSSNIHEALQRTGQLGQIDVLLTDDPRLAGLEKIIRPKAVFYRATDWYAKIKGDETLTTAERLLLPHCAGVIATARPVLNRILTLKPGLPCLLLENGVQHEVFSWPVEEAPELKDIPHPRVIYVGVIDFRFDFAAVEYLARHYPKVHFVIIGPGEELARVRAKAAPNIHVLGPKSYDAIPSFLQHCEIGFLPMTSNASNLGRSPMKLYEYGAAGLPVLATITPELERRSDPYLRLYRTYDEAVFELESMLNSPLNRRTVSEQCKSHSWASKAAQLISFLRENMPVESPPAAL